MRDFCEEMFAERVSNPLEWFGHSRALYAAARSTVERADLIIDRLEKSDLMNVATMLYGFSLENLFKAIWIYDRYGSPYDDNWRPDAEFPNDLKTHDLGKLARLTCSELAREFEFSLSILTQVVTWSGRYPCSLKGDEGTIGRWPQINGDAEKIFTICSKRFTIGS